MRNVINTATVAFFGCTCLCNCISNEEPYRTPTPRKNVQLVYVSSDEWTSMLDIGAQSSECGTLTWDKKNGILSLELVNGKAPSDYLKIVKGTTNGQYECTFSIPFSYKPDIDFSAFRNPGLLFRETNFLCFRASAAADNTSTGLSDALDVFADYGNIMDMATSPLDLLVTYGGGPANALAPVTVCSPSVYPVADTTENLHYFSLKTANVKNVVFKFRGFAYNGTPNLIDFSNLAPPANSVPVFRISDVAIVDLPVNGD